MKKILIFICMSALLLLTSCGNNDETIRREQEKSIDNRKKENNTDMNGYTKVTLVDLERNPNKYIGTKIAVEGEVYCTNVNGKDYIMTYKNDNMYTITISRDYTACDTEGNQVGYLVNGDKCVVYGVLREETVAGMGNYLTIETEDVIIY